MVWDQFCCLNMCSGHRKLLDIGLIDTGSITLCVCVYSHEPWGGVGWLIQFLKGFLLTQGSSVFFMALISG